MKVTINGKTENVYFDNDHPYTFTDDGTEYIYHYERNDSVKKRIARQFGFVSSKIVLCDLDYTISHRTGINLYRVCKRATFTVNGTGYRTDFWNIERAYGYDD